METITVIEKPTEKVQDQTVADDTPEHEECDMNHSNDDADGRDDEEEYIAGTFQTTPHRRTKGPQTRHRKRIDEANFSWDPSTVSDLDETPKKSEGRPARGRRSTKRP
jgi:hypothetical protein